MNSWLKIAGVAAALALPAISFASDGSSLEKNIRCTNTVGAPVVNVEVRVINNADSGIAGNYWALDALKRHITVWKTTTAGTFCATVRDEGKFRTFAGQQSPGNTTVLSGNERGEIKGGYVGTITGSLLASPLWKTKGHVDTIDYQCDVSGNCPGYVSWLSRYFNPGYGFDYLWWGWTYRGGKFGTWVNAVSGNLGDIHPAVSVSDDSDDDSDDSDE